MAVTGAELEAYSLDLGQELARGLEEVIFDADLWMRCQTMAEGIGAAVAQGLDPSLPAAVLDGLPPPANARQQTILHLLRATALLDGDAPTAAVRCVAQDLNSADPRHTLAQADYILRAIVFSVWTNRLRLRDPGAHDLAMRHLWHAILEKYRSAVTGRTPVPPGQRQRDLIVLLTGQFMRGMHQPSIDTLDFVRKLVLRFGRRVVLVNTADGPVSKHFPYLGGFTSSVDEGLFDRRQLVVDKLPIPFIHLPAGFTDPQMAAAALDQILALKPDMVLSFGTLSPVADLCRGLLDVVAIPYGSYLPFAEPTYLALPRPLNPSDLPALAIGGLTADRVTSINYSYAPPAMGEPKTRAGLQAPDGAILTAIIGLRLSQEVTPAFAAALDAAVRAEPRLFFLFVGAMDNYDAVVGAHPALAARARAQGFETDVMSILAVTDLYINPPRGGGGTSAAYALSRGVPAYSLNVGDVATVVGPDFHLADYADFAPAAARFADDPAWRAAIQAKARAQFTAISSREGTLRQILDGVKAMRATG